jgi:hypothetical protein
MAVLRPCNMALALPLGPHSLYSPPPFTTSQDTCLHPSLAALPSLHSPVLKYCLQRLLGNLQVLCTKGD